MHNFPIRFAAMLQNRLHVFVVHFTEVLCLDFLETAVKFCGLWIWRLGIKGD